MIGEFLRRLRYYLRRRQFEAELDEEMRHHLAMKERDAGAAAQPQFGNVTLLKEDSRAMWAWTFWEQLIQDLRYAFRTMNANRAFTALAVLSLALGIGANAAIYSFMDAILLRALPVSDPESLVVLNWHAKSSHGDSVMHSMDGFTWDDESGESSGIFPFQAFELFRKNVADFASVFGYSPAYPALNIVANGQAEVLSGEFVSGDYFRGLAVSPAAGRLLMPDDDRDAAPAVAVLSHAFSQRRFGVAANAAGQTVLINNAPFTVVGVTPPEFFGVDPAVAPDVYLPFHADGSRARDYVNPNYYWVEVMGRLRPGVSLAHAQVALAPQFQRWVAATAANDTERSNLPSLVLKEGATGLDNLRREYSKPLLVLLALVGLILGLACANVANLLLARAAGRRREMALRLSIGAGRFRLVRQLLTESVLLASLGGALGVLIAIWGIRFLTLLVANGDPSFTLHAQLNWHLLGAAAALSLLTGVLFGLAPALQSTHVDVMPALKETRAGQTGARHPFLRVSLSQVLVSGQIAISLLMLVAAGLFVKTLSNLHSVDLGFNRENLLLFELNAAQAGHKSPEISTFYGDLRKRLGEIPGVRNVTMSNRFLIRAGFSIPVSLPGRQPIGNRLLTVGPGFFSTMQIPILAGREILESDRSGAPAVAVINQRFAKANFGDRSPLGEHLTLRKGRSTQAVRDMEIVGVCKDARYGGLKGEVPQVAFIAYDQGLPEPDRMVYELRTAGDPLMYVNSAREIVRRADSRLPLANVKSQAADIDQTINQEIVFARLCTGFAFLGLVIACVGLYGTVAYNVARRTGEIGIRMALGAQRGSVVRMILSQVFVLAAVGLAIGLPAALLTSKFVESFLYGMRPNDPLTLTLAVAILLGAALLAGYAPARRASGIDPMTALRHE